MVVDAVGNVHAVGWFNGAVDFDPGPEVFELTSFGSSDVVLWSLDADGNFVSANQFGGTGSEGAYGSGLALDKDGNLYVASQFSGTADLDPGPTEICVTSTGSTDVFLAKLTSGGCARMGPELWRRRHRDSIRSRGG